ncbi:MAG TPA: hypothetical protein VIJ15_04745 [Dermatophilaceae bacterium]
MTPVQPEPRDADLIRLLVAHAGAETQVTLHSRRVLHVINIAWGYDTGDAYAHVTTNTSPAIEDRTVAFFYTSDVLKVTDPASGDMLYQRTQR